mmetsp:Transcript_79232/g.175723  ORF Transcript_79232/g.175723 Transcript_79232/m.175723 type:complete len:330 (+) Transcript_79232:199-1188(+)
MDSTIASNTFSLCCSCSLHCSCSNSSSMLCCSCSAERAPGGGSSSGAATICAFAAAKDVKSSSSPFRSSLERAMYSLGISRVPGVTDAAQLARDPGSRASPRRNLRTGEVKASSPASPTCCANRPHVDNSFCTLVGSFKRPTASNMEWSSNASLAEAALRTHRKIPSRAQQSCNTCPRNSASNRGIGHRLRQSRKAFTKANWQGGNDLVLIASKMGAPGPSRTSMPRSWNSKTKRAKPASCRWGKACCARRTSRCSSAGKMLGSEALISFRTSTWLRNSCKDTVSTHFAKDFLTTSCTFGLTRPLLARPSLASRQRRKLSSLPPLFNAK